MNNKFNNINKIICKRSRIINFKLLFLFIAKKLSSYSYSKIRSLFSLDFVPFTKTAIINKRKNISSIFYDLNNDFLNFSIILLEINRPGFNGGSTHGYHFLMKNDDHEWNHH
jgi:hypothetical protein